MYDYWTVNNTQYIRGKYSESTMFNFYINVTTRKEQFTFKGLYKFDVP